MILNIYQSAAVLTPTLIPAAPYNLERQKTPHTHTHVPHIRVKTLKVTRLNAWNLKQVDLINLHNTQPVLSLSAGCLCVIFSTSTDPFLMLRLSISLEQWWETVSERPAEQSADGPRGTHIRIHSLTWPIYLQPGDRWRRWMLKIMKGFKSCFTGFNVFWMKCTFHLLQVHRWLRSVTSALFSSL